MFDSLKNLANLPEMMKKAQVARAQMEQVQQDLGNQQFTADAGGGRVKATVTGRLEVVRVKIDKDRLNLQDVEMLEDLVVAAVHAAQVQAANYGREQMAKISADLGLPPEVMGG